MLAMILEYLAPSARRRTRAAGTTEASLLGLLDVEYHDSKVQKGVFEVNPPFGGRNREFNRSLEARGGVEPPIKVLQTFALPLGDRASGVSILPERKPGITLFQFQPKVMP